MALIESVITLKKHEFDMLQQQLDVLERGNRELRTWAREEIATLREILKSRDEYIDRLESNREATLSDVVRELRGIKEEIKNATEKRT